MREGLKPVFIYSSGTQIGSFGKILVKIQSAADPEVLADLESVWSHFAPHRPFLFSYLDEDVDQFYRDDIRQGRLLGTFSIVSILLASMGLFGLASFMVKQRRKEIGIRKILGASVASVVGLLCREYMILTAAAFIVAIPATFVLMHQWLSEFAYSSGIGWGLVLSLGAVTLAGTLITVSYQAITAALANPVHALKHE
jgi:putative ABC transport system permease protein